MKSADEWADYAADMGDYGVRRRIAIVRAIQLDVIESAVMRMKAAQVYAVDVAQNTRAMLVAEVEKLKDTVGGEKESGR